MKRLKNNWVARIFILYFLLFGQAVFASDTCMFMRTADDVPPNIVFLMDNGAEMEHIVWHSDYDNGINYTPNVAVACDVVGSVPGVPPVITTNDTLVLVNIDETEYPFAEGSDVEGLTSGADANVVTKVYVSAATSDSGQDELHLEIDSVVGGPFTVGETVRRYKNVNNIATGTLLRIDVPPVVPPLVSPCPNGFFNEYGYALDSQGGTWRLVMIGTDLVPDTSVVSASTGDFTATVNGVSIEYATFTINTKTISIPTAPSAAVDADGIKDNAAQFRYSKNYLNWLFYAEDAGGSPLYAGNGSDLPTVSRFYYSKQALMIVGKGANNRAEFGIYNFTSTSQGASNVQPLGLVATTPLAADPANNTLDSAYVNNLNNMGTVTYSPLAEGLATIGGYFDSPSSGVVASYCTKNYAIVVSPGLSSEDQDDASQYKPATLEDYDDDAGGIGEGNIQADSSTFVIPTRTNGSTWLDDVAYYMYTNDMVGYREGFQNVSTYTIGFMGNRESNLFLVNTSNNGNGKKNIYSTTHADYGKYHFVAESPNTLATAIIDAINDILSRNSTFTAPVVPVTRTTSSNRIYMALFKPKGGTFWDGNVVKFGIDLTTLDIVDANGDAATFPNGAIKETAVPFWETINWASADYANYMENRTGFSNSRKIYTYLGTTTDLTAGDNAFTTTNALLTPQRLGYPPSGAGDTIHYVRGGDVLDEDGDGNITENREIITGDVLHSEPTVFTYYFADDTSKTVVFYGANDGMLHAVLDFVDSDTTAAGGETQYGTEHWAFIPPQHLHRLKNFLDGSNHIDFIDGSPKVYFKDVNGDEIVDSGAGDRVIVVCGERKGGTGFFGLDVTDPDTPLYLWRINKTNDSQRGTFELTTMVGDWLSPTYADNIDTGDPATGTFIGWLSLDGDPVGSIFNYDSW
ncbi:hypothetical protein ACFL9U_15565, partial [Thermodesulfobacteriota bacterium]